MRGMVGMMMMVMVIGEGYGDEGYVDDEKGWRITTIMILINDFKREKGLRAV